MRPAEQLTQAANQLTAQLNADVITETIRQPIIILSAPRSGSNLLYETVTQQAGFWSIGGESHIAFASMPHLRFENDAVDSACLNESHADTETQQLFRAELLYLARDHQSRPFVRTLESGRSHDPICLVEKTPRNALNIPFIRKIFPNAKYIYLHRSPEQNIASIIEAWTVGLSTGRFSMYPDLPGWDRATWCFILPKGWRKMKGKSLAEIAAFQWQACNDAIINGLADVDATNKISIDYQSFVDEPADTIKDIIDFAGLEAREIDTSTSLALSKTALSPPDPEKWKKHQQAILPLIDSLKETISSINSFS